MMGSSRSQVDNRLTVLHSRLVVLESGLGLESGLNLDLKALDLDMDSDLEVLPASPF